ncbi:diguanylate cyclase [Pseudomonas sp. BN606]|uniref:diguanylate cyclase domain-containing protein n=2 Tax=unclassified Pseudomonas TaxID=196821 RepID=UPI0024545885|nr:diguanylate cyclase [Pseudomonas sp. BN606]
MRWKGLEMEKGAYASRVKPRLLLVDDQPLNIRALSELFRFDHEIYMATDGEQAIELAERLHPDLVLLDVVMPGIDGYEVCRRLKTNPITADISIIFVSAMGEEEDEARGLEMGAVDYIGKPFHPGIARARVKTHLTLKLQSDRLRNLATLDGLTGIPNRRAFDQRLAAAWNQSCRDAGWLGLILIDIDYFKRFNDHYGHLMGDECLRRVAAALENAIRRPFDMVARYGGEEFICILPGTNLNGAATVATQLAASVRDMQIPHAQSAVADSVTISQGVVSLMPVIGQDPTQLVSLADKALYKAKEDGRARFSLGEPVL